MKVQKTVSLWRLIVILAEDWMTAICRWFKRDTLKNWSSHKPHFQAELPKIEKEKST